MVCKSGARSLRAAGFLVNHGYTNAVNMQHGMIRWATKGFPTKGDTAVVLGNTAITGDCCAPQVITEDQKNKSVDRCGGTGDCC